MRATAPEHPCLAAMKRFLSPGYQLRPPKPPEPKRAVGRPKRPAPEGALDLGEKRPRLCASKKALSDEMRIAALERKVEALHVASSQEVSRDERVDKLMQLVEQADEDTAELRERMMGRRRSFAGSSGGLAVERQRELGHLGSEFGHFGHLGAVPGAVAAATASAEAGCKGGQLSSERLATCRAAGREGGVRGAAFGKFGGRPPTEAAAAPTSARKGLVRPAKFEPKVGHQQQAVKYIREQLYARGLGKFDAEKEGKEGWEEPEASDVEDDVWAEIRSSGFGKKVRSRDLKRIWRRRAQISLEVELLELGKSGGIFRKAQRTLGKARRMSIGQGMRSVVALEPAPKRRRVEGQEEPEGGQELVAVRKQRQSALKDVFERVKAIFVRWRMAGQYVDREDFSVLCLSF